MSRRFPLRLLALTAVLCPAAALAAPVGSTQPVTGRAEIVKGSSFIRLMDMDFGIMAVTTAGTAVINSTTDALTTTGGVLLLAGSPHAARFEAVSPVRNVVKISLPKQPVTLKRVGGTETMTIDTWTINGAATRNVVAHETFEFRVGGTLRIGANQVEGVYTGTFDVTINYN